MLQINDCYHAFLSSLGVLANVKAHSDERVLRKNICKTVTFADDSAERLADVRGAYYRQLNHHKYLRSLQIETIAWVVGEANADLQELYDRS
jgi:hypothetical protein